MRRGGASCARRVAGAGAPVRSGADALASRSGGAPPVAYAARAARTCDAARRRSPESRAPSPSLRIAEDSRTVPTSFEMGTREQAEDLG
jgi:hypothetical protein